MKPYYEEDGITIYHGDCRDILPTLPKVDLVLTDPPYGDGNHKSSGFNGGMKRTGTTKLNIQPSRHVETTQWDVRPSDATMRLVITCAPAAIVWGGNYFASVLGDSRKWLVWDKENGESNFSDCELAWTNLSGVVRKFTWRWHGFFQQEMAPGKREQRLHPTQKPQALIKWAIGLASQPQTILDPFMGSGTTLVAAKQLGRKAIGIEIEEKYCEIAVKRLAQMQLNFKEAI